MLLRWPGLALVAAALFVAAPAAHAATVCRAGRVEMIVGGTAAADCTGAPVSTTALTTPAARSPASASLRVEPAVQRVRDEERRRILEEEFQHEQALLGSLLRQGPAADPAALGRARANIAALQGELARLPPVR
jgi:hypothetical protein